MLGAALIALRAGPLLLLAVALVARLGIGARPLHLAGTLLLALVPAVYVLFPPRDRGGFNFDYASELVGAHWLAVAALVLIALGLWRTLSAWRPRASRDRAAAAPGPGPAA